MWEVSNYNQVISFLVSLCFGALYCLFYDIFRSIRKIGYNDTLSVAVQDVFFFLVIAFITFMIMLVYTCGEIRFYILFAIALGFIICNFTLSRIFRKVLVFIFKQISRILTATKSLLKRLKSKILRYFMPIKDFLVKNFKNLPKTLKNHLKQRCKVVYTKTDV